MRNVVERLLVLFVIIVLGYQSLTFLPASIWMDVKSVRVLDTAYGQPVMVSFERSINREFQGKYSVSIRNLTTGLPVCWASAELTYRPQPNVLASKTLEWWGAGLPRPCTSEMLVPGTYAMTTTWTIHPAWPFLPDQTVTITSDDFEITLPEPGADYLLQQQRSLEREVDSLKQQLDEVQQ